MKILYLHGLDGSLNDDKRIALEKYGKVFGPNIDYRTSNNKINFLIEEYKNENIDIVIGNSLGGLAAYYISLIYNTPCLIYNPALPYASVVQNIPNNLPDRKKYLQVVLGRQDDVINAGKNIEFLDLNIKKDLTASVHILNSIGHRIPIEDFEIELDFFFKNLRIAIVK